MSSDAHTEEISTLEVPQDPATQQEMDAPPPTTITDKDAEGCSASTADTDSLDTSSTTTSDAERVEALETGGEVQAPASETQPNAPIIQSDVDSEDPASASDAPTAKVAQADNNADEQRPAPSQSPRRKRKTSLSPLFTGCRGARRIRPLPADSVARIALMFDVQRALGIDVVTMD